MGCIATSYILILPLTTIALNRLSSLLSIENPESSSDYFNAASAAQVFMEDSTLLQSDGNVVASMLVYDNSTFLGGNSTLWNCGPLIDPLYPSLPKPAGPYIEALSVMWNASQEDSLNDL